MNFFRNRPLVCAISSFIVSLALSFAISNFIRVPLVCVLLILYTAIAVILILWRKIRKRPFSDIFKTFIASLICSAIALSIPIFMLNIKNMYAYELSDTTAYIRATVTKVYVEESGYASFIAKVGEANGKKVDFSVLIFTEFSPSVSLDDVFVCNALLTPKSADFYYSEMSLKRQNILYSVTLADDCGFKYIGKEKSFISHIRDFGNKLGFKMDRAFSNNTAALSKALLLGDRHELPSLLERDFRRIGISHLLALSGMHLALITGAIMRFLKFFIPSAKVRSVTVSLIAVAVILITGASASILRAGLMLIYYHIGSIFREHSDIMTALFAVTCIIILFNPYSIFDIGLILSFSATFGIALLMPKFNEMFFRIFKNPFGRSVLLKPLRYCFDSLCMSFSAGVFVTVASIFIFDSVSLITAFTTLIFTPLIVLLMFTSSISLVLSNIPHISTLLHNLAEFFSDTIYSLASEFSKLDHIVISTNNILLKAFTVIFIVVFTVCVIRDTKIYRFILYTLSGEFVFALLLGVYMLASPKDIHVCVWADEKENGIILTDGMYSAYIDISYGKSDNNAAQSNIISEYEDADLDVYILTHYHFKYFTTIRKFNEYTLIRKLLMPVPANETDMEYAAMIEEMAERYGIEFEYYNISDTIDINGVSFTSLPYERLKKTAHPCIAFMLERNENKIVYTGGYNQKCESYEALVSELKDADILITGTHGPKAEPLTDIAPGDCIIYDFSDEIFERELILREKLLGYGSHEIAVFEENFEEKLAISERRAYITDHFTRR